jgi:P27 family predicted phage terminase small subunit
MNAHCVAMGQRGPLPEPTKAKKLKGNPGHRPLPDDEPEPELLDQVPEPPEWMPRKGCDAWELVTSELHKAQMLHALDLPVLELFCVAYHQWREILDAVEREGYTYRAYDDEGNLKYAQQTPEAVLASKFAKDINTWAKVLGLGPAYRVGLRIGRSESDKAIDPIAEALAGKPVEPINPPPKRKKAATRSVRGQKTATKKAPAKRATKKKT